MSGLVTTSSNALWGRERSFRQALEALKAERVLFDAGVALNTDPQTAFPLFVERCEDVMRTEGKSYWERYKSKKQEAHPS